MQDHIHVIATDGSSGNGPTSGWAWYDDSDRYGYGTVPGPSPLTAELVAMQRGISAVPAGSRVLVRSDCRPALALVEERLSTGIVRHRAGRVGARATAEALHHIAVLASRRRVAFEWVKGHDSDRMNLAADRMARQARRAVQLGNSLDRLEPLFDRIAAEYRAA